MSQSEALAAFLEEFASALRAGEVTVRDFAHDTWHDDEASPLHHISLAYETQHQFSAKVPERMMTLLERMA